MHAATLPLERALQIIRGALHKGRETGCDPLSVAVLDAGGHLVAFMRQDESGILRPQIAIAKAYGALGFGVGSRELKEKNPLFLNAVATASWGRMIPAPGGVLIRSAETGQIIGAVGISGDTADKDEAAAIAGIELNGLRADAGEA
jgi:uncharacterized protein GlcG (DUF336 family)